MKKDSVDRKEVDNVSANSVKLKHLLDAFSLATQSSVALYFGKSHLYYETGFDATYLDGHMDLFLTLFRKCDELPRDSSDAVWDADSRLAAKAILSRSGSTYSIMGYLLVAPAFHAAPAESAETLSFTADVKKQQEAICSLLHPLCSFIVSEGYLSLFYQKQVSAFHQIVWDHPDSDWSIVGLCQIFGISKTTLYDNFATYTGMTVAEYIKSVRLEKARYLLSASDDSITDISAKVGFNDYNYFLRVFKKAFGQSAGNYRKQAHSNRK